MGLISASSLGFDLDQADRKLFAEASSAFHAIGAAISIDKTDSENMV